MELIHVITVGTATVTLTPAEAKLVIRGTIPRALAQSLAERGITVPKRGTIPFHIEGYTAGVRIFRSEAHLRQVPVA